jgi:asparagine synthase (glutamine-hydrolysing)
MCGIAGIVGVIDPPVAEGAVRKMVCALARRGPDAGGIESWGEAVLGHRRLAIYDLSEAGRQPMVSADRSLGIVFNGSIYNYRELREELIARGYIFGSHTDTEVLIHGYREWGLDKLISKLRGMFALGLWDDRIRKLYLVRDRLGVKPLVFSICNRVLIFASTIRALRVAGFVGDLDENAVTDFLEFGFITDARSIYRGAVKVPAASIIEWSNGTLNKRKYWVPPIAATSPTPSFHEAVEETERLFLRSVEVRLHADVPVGALLSSGIDSGLVCWAAAKLGGDVTAYTIGTPGDPEDEAMAAGATARIIGIKHQVLEMSERDAPEIGELVSAYAEPFACASALGMLRVSRAIAPSAKVLLTGDGGDDVFLGYPRHLHLWLAGKLARGLPSTAKHAWLACRSAFPRIGPLRRAAALFDYATGGLGAVVGNSAGLWSYGVNGLLGDRLLSLPLDRRRTSWSIDPGCRILADFLDYERQTRFVGEYMTKVDGATMHYALEARSPFLDHVLWEFASSLPFEVRLHRGRLKAILREVARRRIAKEVARRGKRGFSIPVQRWMVGRWRSEVETALRESILNKEGWIRSGSVLSQLELAVRKGWAPYQLWYLFVLESWMRHEQQ